MKPKTLDLNKMGLELMYSNEMEFVDGGQSLSKVIRKGIWGYVIKEIIDHWEEEKKRFVDGWKLK
jgi:hypothetical protein